VELENASGKFISETFHPKPEKPEHHMSKVILGELRFQVAGFRFRKIRTSRAQLEPVQIRL
jgi:hypothetical protein